MECETKTARIDQKSTFLCLFFFLKIQNRRKPKTPIFERGQHKNFLGQVLTIFQTSPNMKRNGSQKRLYQYVKSVVIIFLLNFTLCFHLFFYLSSKTHFQLNCSKISRDYHDHAILTFSDNNFMQLVLIIYENIFQFTQCFGLLDNFGLLE